MIKRFNKRGQETGLGLGTLLALIVGVLALVLIVAGLFGWLGPFFSAVGLLPNDLTKMSAACGTYSQQEALVLSYCQFNEGRIEGKKGFYNCDFVYAAAVKSLGEANVGWNKLSVCSVDVAKNYCTSLMNTEGENYKEKTIVNGETCKDLGIPKPVAA